MKTSLRRSFGKGSFWSRWFLAAAVAAAGILGFSGEAQAALTPDAQMSTQTNSTLAQLMMAQTFKAEHTGLLSEVDLYSATGFFRVGLWIEIWSVDQGLPTAAVSTTAVPNTLGFNPAWHQFTLATKVPVITGGQYAIVTHAALSNYFRWGYFAGANYGAGKMLSRFGTSWMGFAGLPAGSAFTFKTFVDTSAPAPKLPLVGHDTAIASSDEATAPTMTGTYSDPNGGTVSLTADHGKVSPTSGTGGAWTWTGDVYDEDTAPSSVTITATTVAGSATTQFPVNITGVKPTVAILANRAAATLASNPEGGVLTLNASASSTDPADQAAGFTYTWKVTRNGANYRSTAGASFTFLDTDEATYVVVLTATDDGGQFNTATMTVTWAEITPAVTISSIAPADGALTIIAPQETLNFNGTFVDASPEPHTYSWDFGDGTPPSTTLSTTHAYAVAGTYTATLTVWDDEKVSGSASATVKVLTTEQSLDSMVGYVRGLKSLNTGQQNSLIAKLGAAEDASARGDNTAAHNQLNAFINELDADYRTGKISAAAFDALRADAHAIQGALGTFNRFMEWWPLAA